MAKRISVKEAARQLGLSKISVRNKMESGELPIGMIFIHKNRKGDKTRRTFVIYEDLLEEARRGLRDKHE